MAKKKYYKLSINCKKTKSDIIIGLINCYLDINSFEEIEDNNENTLHFYLEQKKTDLIVLSNFIKDKIEAISIYTEIKKIEYDPAIETQWKKYFKPFKITKNIVIKPSWETYKNTNKNEIIITLDPGTAFGTGLHETTKAISILLEEHMCEHNKNIRLLDAGTGSGILSLIANKLGIKNIESFDIDKEAILVANENFNINNVNNIKTYVCDFKDIKAKYNIILANIISEVLITNYKYFDSLSKKDSLIFLSGILIKEKEKVINEFTKYKKFKLINSLDINEWTSLVLKKLV